VVTLGELRGGNLSLASSADMLLWRDEGALLSTRPGHWDNATLSAGPAPVRLSDGNWLLLCNVGNLWPVQSPQPLPVWGRCALGWAVLHRDDPTRGTVCAVVDCFAVVPLELAYRLLDH
jgi:predicted GH43/DUF377 family glycosyl hydrolase